MTIEDATSSSPLACAAKIAGENITVLSAGTDGIDGNSPAAAQQYEGGSMGPMIYSQRLTTLTEHRTADLKSIHEDGDQKLN